MDDPTKRKAASTPRPASPTVGCRETDTEVQRKATTSNKKPSETETNRTYTRIRMTSDGDAYIPFGTPVVSATMASDCQSFMKLC